MPPSRPSVIPVASAWPIAASAPLTVVVPDFPAGANAGADGVRIDVAGTILRSGELQFERMDVPPGQARFGEAVAQVLRW